MSRSVKAALLSALVFPGIGHFFLKRPVQGILLAGVSIVCVYFFMSASIEMAQEIVVKIRNGEMPLDMIRIMQELSKQSEGRNGQLVNGAVFILTICWLAGIIDSCRVGRAQDKKIRIAAEESADTGVDGWFAKSLGDGILASEPLAHIKEFFLLMYAGADEPKDMAVFIRYESQGDLHCEVKVYFPPASIIVAREVDAQPCQRPPPDGLDLLVGSADSWSVLFPGTGKVTSNNLD
jgi:hypothetical protein